MMPDNSYGTAATQAVLLPMMKDFHDFCIAKGIRYSLAGGSLLGAVRHNGFIPWDDDADIMMDRENYQRFLSEAGAFDGYTVVRDLWIYRIRKKDHEEENPPTIDIFVMDHTPNGRFRRSLKTVTVKMLQGMMKKKPIWSSYSLPNRVLVFATHFIGLFMSDRKKFSWYEKVSRIGNDRETEYVTCYNDLFKLLSVCYDADTMERLELHPFEDTELFITTAYDSYLTRQYGDYMTPPKEIDRIPQHG